jgi:hypothetical protein
VKSCLLKYSASIGYACRLPLLNSSAISTFVGPEEDVSVDRAGGCVEDDGADCECCWAAAAIDVAVGIEDEGADKSSISKGLWSTVVCS